MNRPQVRRIEVNGELPFGVYAKDVILHIIRKLGVQGGVGYAYEYAGEVFDRMTMEERMTVCNMSIEGAPAADTSIPTRRRSNTSAAGRWPRRARSSSVPPSGG